MSSEASDIDMKVALEIEPKTLDPDTPRAVFIELKPVGGVIHAGVRAYGFTGNDDGARSLAEALDLIAQGIQTALSDNTVEEDALEASVQLLMESGLSEDMARGAALKTLEMFKLIPGQEPLHPQDPERWAGINSQAELDEQRQAWGVEPERPARHDIHSFETPQHVRDARAARKKARGFNPAPVVRKEKG